MILQGRIDFGFDKIGEKTCEIASVALLGKVLTAPEMEFGNGPDRM
jgi:hypothetical protein